MKVYQNMIILKIKPSNVTYSILIKIFSQINELENALGVLEQMKRE
jgi:pentatricopeptide repeat protein